MSVETAKNYITRMRTDDAFRNMISAAAESGEQAGWDLVREQGYEFSMQDFQKARDEIYEEYGINPM